MVLFHFFFFSSRRRHTRSVSAFLLNRSSDLVRSVVASGRQIAINGHIKFNLTIPLQQLNGLETLVIIMVANKYAFLQIRSEERRVGKECRSRGSRDNQIKKEQSNDSEKVHVR